MRLRCLLLSAAFLVAVVPFARTEEKSVLKDGNYILSTTTASATATINRKSVTPAITADDKDYDGTATATIHCTLSGVLAGDASNVTCSGTGSFADANAGPGNSNVKIRNKGKSNRRITEIPSVVPLILN